MNNWPWFNYSNLIIRLVWKHFHIENHISYKKPQSCFIHRIIQKNFISINSQNVWLIGNAVMYWKLYQMCCYNTSLRKIFLVFELRLIFDVISLFWEEISEHNENKNSASISKLNSLPFIIIGSHFPHGNFLPCLWLIIG